MTDVAPIIRATLANALGVDLEELAAGLSLYDDLGADSLAIMEILTALEDALGIELPATNEFALSIRTVGDVVAAFEIPDT